MARIYLGVVLSAMLLLLIGFFIQRNSTLKENLKIAYWHLSGNFVINEYLGERIKSTQSHLNYEVREHPSFARIVDASRELNDMVDTLNVIYLKKYEPQTELDFVQTTQARTYFSERISVDPKIRERLWRKFQLYRNDIEAYLETDVKGMRDHYASVLVQDSDQFRKIELNVQNMKPGNFQQTFFMHVFKDTVIARTIFARKTDRGIEWSKQLYDDYIAYLQQKTYSSRPVQLKKLLSKFGDSFLTKGKLSIYGKTYDLSDLTVSELATVCTYVRMEKFFIDNAFLETSQELNPL